MGKTRDLFKKTRGTKGTFHAKMSRVKDRNVLDQTEAEDTKDWWQEHTEEQYRKGLNDPNNHDGVITPRAGYPGCEVRLSLGSIAMNKVSGGDGIPVEPFEILKDVVLKCCPQYASKFGKLSSSHRTGKGQFSFQSQRRAMPMNVQTIAQLHSFHLLSSNVQNPSRLQQYVYQECSDVQAGFRRGRGTRTEIANIHRIIEK